MEEKLSCIDPHLALKTTSNAPKKSSNKPKKLRKAPILGYYSVLASDLPSTTCSETDDGEVEDERGKLAPNVPDPAPVNTLNNSEPAKKKPHAFQPVPEKDARKNPMNAEGREGADRVPGDGEGGDQHEAVDENEDKTFPPIPLKKDAFCMTLEEALTRMQDKLNEGHIRHLKMFKSMTEEYKKK